MDNERDKYSKILDILRKSRTLPDSSYNIEEEVMERITRINRESGYSSGIFDILFGWVNIGWIRRSLATGSILLLVFFAWQNNTILKQMDNLAARLSESGRVTSYDPNAALEKRKALYRISNDFPGRVTLSTEDFEKLLDSLDALNVRYRDLLDIIESDTAKMRSLEKLNRKNRSKFKL